MRSETWKNNKILRQDRSLSSQTRKRKKDFLENVDFQEGCAFCLIQIGEAVGRLPDNVKEISKDTEWGEIKGLRNILAHRYGTVWPTGIWQTITKDVPTLKEVCVSMLKVLSDR